MLRGPLAQQLAGGGQHRAEVDAAQVGREFRVAGDLGVEDGLHQRAQVETVAGADQVDRRPHDRGADDPPALEQRGEGLGAEAAQARPERGVGVERLLGLQPDQALHGVEGAQSARSSSSWRASVARFRALALSVSGATGPAGYSPVRAPPDRSAPAGGASTGGRRGALVALLLRRLAGAVAAVRGLLLGRRRAVLHERR